MKSYFVRMFRFVAWEDRTALEALRATPAAHGDALPLLAHLLAAEHLWLARLEQRDPRHPVWPTLNLEECATLLTENESGYRAYVERLGENQLAEGVHYRTTQGQEFVTRAVDLLTQVITHGSYHRGQIARIIGRAGGSAINTDFITFAREIAQDVTSTEQASLHNSSP